MHVHSLHVPADVHAFSPWSGPVPQMEDWTNWRPPLAPLLQVRDRFCCACPVWHGLKGQWDQGLHVLQTGEARSVPSTGVNT